MFKRLQRTYKNIDENNDLVIKLHNARVPFVIGNSFWFVANGFRLNKQDLEFVFLDDDSVYIFIHHLCKLPALETGVFSEIMDLFKNDFQMVFKWIKESSIKTSNPAASSKRISSVINNLIEARNDILSDEFRGMVKLDVHGSLNAFDNRRTFGIITLHVEMPSVNERLVTMRDLRKYEVK